MQRTDARGGKYLAGYVVPRLLSGLSTEERESVEQERVEQDESSVPTDSVDKVGSVNDDTLAAARTKTMLTLPQELKVHLALTLPDYMVPTAIVLLDALPLTSNGKVNRKALPEPTLGSSGENEYIAPRNSIEEQLVAIWSRVLDLERVSVEENFFDVGGNSLLLIKIFNELKQVYPDMELNVTDLFKYNSIAKLAEFLQTVLPQELPIHAEEETEEDDEIEEFIM
jgi:acyl carrier protein